MKTIIFSKDQILETIEMSLYYYLTHNSIYKKTVEIYFQLDTINNIEKLNAYAFEKDPDNNDQDEYTICIFDDLEYQKNVDEYYFREAYDMKHDEPIDFESDKWQDYYMEEIENNIRAEVDFQIDNAEIERKILETVNNLEKTLNASIIDPIWIAEKLSE